MLRNQLMTSNRTVNNVSLRQTMFFWRTKNVWCIESAPAELEDAREAFNDVKTDSNRVFFKLDPVVLKNKEWMSGAFNTCWTWCGNWRGWRNCTGCISYTVFMWICCGNTWISDWMLCVFLYHWTNCSSVWRCMWRRVCLKNKDWCVVLIPAKPVTETVYDLKENIVAWRTENVICVELIPAELEASAETVHEVKAESNRFSLRRTLSLGEQRMIDVLN